MFIKEAPNDNEELHPNSSANTQGTLEPNKNTGYYNAVSNEDFGARGGSDK